MAQEITISGLVPEEEIKSLQKLLSIFKDTSKSYADLAVQLSGGLRIKPGSLDELKLKVENSTSILKQQADTQNQLAKLQKDYQSVVNKLTEATKQRTATIIEEAKANDINAAAELKAQKAETERLKQQKMLNQETKNRKVSIEEVTQLLNYEANSYYETNQAVLTLERGLKSMSASEVNSPVGQETVAKIQALKKNLTDLDARMGNYQRNVGNYKSVWNGLQYQMQMISREVPNFFIDMRAGIISLSNNLPYLQDEFIKANKAYKEYIAAVKAGNTDIAKVDSAFKTMVSSIFSWQTAIIVAISLSVQYSKEIGNWVTSLFNGNKALVTLISSETQLAIARKKGMESSASERAELDLLYSKLKDNNISVTERNAVYQEWVKKHPEYSNILKGESVDIGLLNKAYLDLKNQIVATAMAKAYMDKITELTTKGDDALVKRQNQYVTYQKAVENYSTAVSKYNKMEEEGFGTATAKLDAKKKVEDARLEVVKSRDNWLDLIKTTKSYDSAIDAVQKKIDVGKLFPQPKEGTKQYWENLRTQSMSVLDSIDSKQKKMLDAGKTAGIDKSIVDSYKKAMSDLKKANDNIEIYDNVKKTNAQVEREQERHDRYMKRIDAELAKANATAIEQERENEIADIEAKYKEREVKIKGYSDKEMELRKALSVAMNKEINDVNEKYDTQIEQANLERRLDAIREDTLEELNQRLQIQLSANELLRNTEIREAEKRGEDVQAVNNKYNAKFLDIIQKNSLAQLGIIEKNADREAQFTDAINLEKSNKIESDYKKGLMNEDQYRDALFNLTKESGEAKLKLLLAEAETELKLYEKTLPQEKVEELRARIKLIKAQIDEFNNGLSNDENNPTKRWANGFSDALKNMQSVASNELGDTANIFGAFTNIIDRFIKHVQETGDDSFKNFWNSLSGADKVEMALSTFGQIFSGVNSLMSNMYDARISEIEKEQDANNDAYDAEEERIQKLEDAGAISSEEAEARKRSAKEKTEARNKELEKQKTELQVKQAKWDKANAVVQSIIATSVAITEALPNLFLAALVGVLGAAQTAMIVAQPIPKYAKGTKDHAGGYAIVGDAGKHEAVLTPSGEAYATPNVPTLVDLPLHSIVVPDAKDFYQKMKLRSDIGLLYRQAELDNSPIMVNVNNDYTRLEKEMREVKESNYMMMKYFKKMSVNNELNALKNKLKS